MMNHKYDDNDDYRYLTTCILRYLDTCPVHVLRRRFVIIGKVR